MGLEEAIGHSLREHAGRTALVEDASLGGRVVGYGELEAMVARLRGQLRALGCAPGQILPLAVERSAGAVALALAAQAEGGACCWLTPKLRVEQLRFVAAACGAVGLVVDGSGARALAGAGVDDLAALRPVALTIGGDPRAAALAALAQQLPLPSLDPWGPASGVARRDAEARADGASTVIFTSGSTGAPKGVRISGVDLLRRAETEIGSYGLGPDDRLLGLLPFSFDVGLNQLHSALLAGATLHLSTAWLRQDLVDAIAGARATGISAVPAVWASAIAGTPEDEPRLLGDAPALRYVTVSGGSLAPSTFDQLARAVGPRVSIHRTYGQTETFRSAILLGANREEHAARRGSVGVAVPGTRVRIARDRTSLAAPDEEGEVLHAGDGTMLGYLADGALTAEKLGAHAALPGEVVVYTGDRGRLDRDGYLYLAGRVDQMIKTQGFRVYPAEIEAVLARHPLVVEAVAFGVPDPLVEQRVVAVVRTRAPVTPEALRAFANVHLPPYMVPREIAIWASLPRTSSGKPALAEIRAQFLLAPP